MINEIRKTKLTGMKTINPIILKQVKEKYIMLIMKV